MRDLVHAVDPEMEETVKRTVQPYFVLEGNVCALLAAKDHVNVFLYDGGDRARPRRDHHRRPRQQTARTVGGAARDEPVNEPALAAMLRQIIANNRAGGWRKLKGTPG